MTSEKDSYRQFSPLKFFIHFLFNQTTPKWKRWIIWRLLFIFATLTLSISVLNVTQGCLDSDNTDNTFLFKQHPHDQKHQFYRFVCTVHLLAIHITKIPFYGNNQKLLKDYWTYNDWMANLNATYPFRLLNNTQVLKWCIYVKRDFSVVYVKRVQEFGECSGVERVNISN